MIRRILFLALLAFPLLAHHPVAAKFDLNKKRTLRGVVTRVDWSNPHVHVLMRVVQSGQATDWAIELESELELATSGWDADSLKPGDAITVLGPAARDGSPQLWGESIVLTSTGRRVLQMTSEAVAFFRPTSSAQPAGPVPRWPDGTPRLGPPPGERGYWAKPGATSLQEKGVSVEVDNHGLLKDINDAGKVAPFQRWARDLYTLRQRRFLQDDPMFLECYPPGAVRQFQMPFGVQFIEDKPFRRIFVMNGGGNHDWRFIYTDGREQKGAIRGNSDNPLFYGNAVGKWEGDTLVVDTRGLNEKFWFSNGGLPHTNRLHLIERFTRTDANTLKYEVTIDDPGAYTRTWTAEWNLQWVPDDLPTYYCQDNRA